MLTIEELRALMTVALQQWSQEHSPAIEECALNQLRGRVLAEDVISDINIPRFNVSAMDGYGLVASEALPDTAFNIVGVSVAGKGFDGPIASGECIRILTGAPVPADIDAVVMQENVSLQDHQIVIKQSHPVIEGQNIRFQGEEVLQGDVVLTKGHRVSSADIMLLASVGRAIANVYSKLKIGVLSTGNELVDPGITELSNSQIYDSNKPYLLSELNQLSDIEAIDLGNLEDDYALIEQKLLNAAQNLDVIISSGAVSEGDYDFLLPVLKAIGTLKSHKVAIKPGKPFLFGQINQTIFFGLPGNPLSTYVGFTQLVKPLLPIMGGEHKMRAMAVINARLTKALKKGQGRLDFQRAIIEYVNGEWQVTPFDQQDSHRVKGLSQANALVPLPAERAQFEANEVVQVIPIAHSGFQGI